MLGICGGLARHILGGGRGEYAGNMPGMEDVLGRGVSMDECARDMPGG
jgi:hypothetical protein